MRDVQTEVSKTECEDLCLSESRYRILLVIFSRSLHVLGFLVDPPPMII